MVDGALFRKRVACAALGLARVAVTDYLAQLRCECPHDIVGNLMARNPITAVWVAKTLQMSTVAVERLWEFDSALFDHDLSQGSINVCRVLHIVLHSRLTF